MAVVVVVVVVVVIVVLRVDGEHFLIGEILTLFML